MKRRWLWSTSLLLAMVCMLCITGIAFAVSACTPGKEHLSEPNATEHTTWAVNIVGDKATAYTVNWVSAFCYARVVYPSYPTWDEGPTDSGRVWGYGGSSATAYGRGTASVFYGHNCDQSNQVK